MKVTGRVVYMYLPYRLLNSISPQTVFVEGVLFSRCPYIRPSETFCKESLLEFNQSLQTFSYLQDKIILIKE